MVSVTTLASYLYCPRKLYLTKVLKIIEPDKAAFVIGTTVHEALELANNNEKDIVFKIKKGIQKKEIKKLYKNNYLHYFRYSIIKNKKRLLKNDLKPIEIFKENQEFILEEAKKRSNNLLNFFEKNKYYGKELWEKLTPKIYSEIALDSLKITINGIIDQIYDFKDHFEIIELKTGKAPKNGFWPSHKIQLACYLIMAKEHFDKPIKAKIKYLNINETRELVYSSFLLDEVKELKFKVQKLLSSNKIPEICKNKNKCGKCFLKEQCFKLK